MLSTAAVGFRTAGVESAYPVMLLCVCYIFRIRVSVKNTDVAENTRIVKYPY